MENDWPSISEKLKEEINDTDGAHVIIEALLNEKDGDKRSLYEKSHWWKFLSKCARIPVEKLKRKAKKIKEEVEEQDQREVEYCRLLRIAPHPVYTQARPQVISKRYVEGDVSWLFRWIYTFTDEEGKIQRKPGWTLGYLKSQLRKGEIKVNKIRKRACYVGMKHIKEGTPDEWADDWI